MNEPTSENVVSTSIQGLRRGVFALALLLIVTGATASPASAETCKAGWHLWVDIEFECSGDQCGYYGVWKDKAVGCWAEDEP